MVDEPIATAQIPRQLAVEHQLNAVAEFAAGDLVHEPRLLCEPRWGCLGAGWYWHVKRLNPLADAGDFLTITRRINGGTTHLSQRVAYWQAAKAVLA